MGRVLIGLLVGLVLGAGGALLLGSRLMGGAMGAGVATGLSAGICSVVQAADDSGLLTPEQIEQVLSAAAANLRSISGDTLPQSADFSRTIAECRSFMNDLRTGQPG